MTRRRPLPRERRASLLADFSGSMAGAIVRRRADIAQKAANAEAELSARARAAFLANMSHELRTPLNAIIGFSDVLLRECDERQEAGALAEYSGFIQESAHNLLEMINELLELTNMHGGGGAFDPEDIDLDEAVEAAIAAVRATQHAPDARFEHREAGGIWAYADPAKCRKVIANTIFAAAASAGPGAHVAVTPQPAPSGRAAVGVVATPAAGAAGGKPDNLRIAVARALTELQAGTFAWAADDDGSVSATVVLPGAPALQNSLRLQSRNPAA